MYREKNQQTMRILLINSHGIGIDSYEKIQQLKKVMVSLKVDTVLLSSLDRKWTKWSESIMAKKLQIDIMKLVIVTSDSRGGKKTKGEWLPGGTISIFQGKWANYITDTYSDKFG